MNSNSKLPLYEALNKSIITIHQIIEYNNSSDISNINLNIYTCNEIIIIGDILSDEICLN